MSSATRSVWLLLAVLLGLVATTAGGRRGHRGHHGHHGHHGGNSHDSDERYDDDDDDDGKHGHKKALFVVGLVAIVLAVVVGILIVAVCVLKKKNRRARMVHNSFTVMPKTAGAEKQKLPEAEISTGGQPGKEGSPYIVGTFLPEYTPTAPAQQELYPPSYSQLSLHRAVKDSEMNVAPVEKA